ncbi:MAG: carbohydrate ABC transporter permease [Candidatus Methanomethylicaceae archaeon]
MKKNDVLTYLQVFIILLFTLFPIYWATIISLRSEKEMYSHSLIPLSITFEHYLSIFSSNPLRGLTSYIKNSLIVALLTTFIAIIIASFSGYTLARLEFKGKNLLSSAILFAYIFPPFILMIPFYILFLNYGLINTYQGLVLAHLFKTVPFCILMMRSFIMSLPKEFEEAALIDGCSRVKVILRIILPISIPALTTIAAFAFSRSWSEFLYALIIIEKESLMTLPIGLMRLTFGEVFRWGEIMAGSLIAAIPPTLVYFIFQKYIVVGIVRGAIKR